MENLKATLIILFGLLLVNSSIEYRIPKRRSPAKTEYYVTKANKILSKYPLIDGHNDLSYMIRENFRNQFHLFDLNDFSTYNLNGTNNVTHTDIKRMKQGQLGGQFWAVYADCETQGKDAVRVHLEQLENMRRLFKRYPDVFQFTGTAAEVRDAFKNGRVASMFGLESGHAIDSSLAILRIFYSLGVRYMTLTHNCNTPWADNNKIDSNATAPRHNGLTDFGKLVIEEMNRIGMIVDLSHVSHKTMLDVLEVTKSPVMFSHSSVHKLCDHTRNVQDDVLYKLKDNKGVIMINFYNGFVTCKATSTLNDVIDHIEYVKNIIGVDYIGIGADYDGVVGTPKDLEDVSKYPNLFAALLEKGWNEEDLAKLAGGNILRVMEANEEYAASVKTKWPIDDIIDPKYIQEAGFTNCRIAF